MAPGSSSPASQTPMWPGRARSASRDACHTASGTITSPASGTCGRAPLAPRSSSSQLSAAGFRSLMSAINVVLERFQSNAANDVDEALGLRVAVRQIDVDQLLDHVRHFILRHRRTEHLAERGIVALIAADRNLIEL